MEKEHSERDASITATNSARNTLEALIYHSRSAVDSDWVVSVSPAEKAAIQQLSQELETWIYGEGENTTKEEYLSRLQLLKAKCDPISDRILNFQAIEQAICYIEQRHA